MKHVLTSRYYLILEFFLLCIALPGFIIFTKSAPFLFLFLWGAAFYGFIILRVVHQDHIKQLWKWEAVTTKNIKPILYRWLVACVAMTVFLYFYDSEQMFNIALTRPYFLPILMLLYPILSALPQEFIFCSFFFKRYRPFFGANHEMIVASTIVFAYAHLLYINPVAPSLSLLGGAIFALTYRKTQSLALVTIEHGLYGNFLFLIGLGWYFFSGNVH